MYEDRNRVVHRFIISEITLINVEHISYKYYVLRGEINELIYKIEEEQITKQVGMTEKGNSLEGKESLREWANEKIGAIRYFDDRKKRMTIPAPKRDEN